MDNPLIKKALEETRHHVDELKREVQTENTELQKAEARKIDIQRQIEAKKKEVSALEMELRTVDRTTVPHLQQLKRQHETDLQKLQQEFNQLLQKK